jgi:hypothetical protein
VVRIYIATLDVGIDCDVGNVTKPEIGKDFPAFVRLRRGRKGDSALIAGQIEAAVWQLDDFNLPGIFFSGCEVIRRQRMDNRGPTSILTSAGIFQKYLPSKSAIIPSGIYC